MQVDARLQDLKELEELRQQMEKKKVEFDDLTERAGDKEKLYLKEKKELHDYVTKIWAVSFFSHSDKITGSNCAASFSTVTKFK